MASDDRPTPPELVHIGYGDADLLGAMGPLLPDDLTYRLSDPDDPLMRLSEVERAVHDSFPLRLTEQANIPDAIVAAVLLRLTAERGEVKLKEQTDES